MKFIIVEFCKFKFSNLIESKIYLQIVVKWDELCGGERSEVYEIYESDKCKT